MSSSTTWQLARDFSRFDHAADVATPGGPLAIVHPVFHAGSGPALLLLHELPGLTQSCVDFAGRLVERKFQVFMPHLVGPLLQDAPLANMLRLCVSREFARLKAGVSAPVTDWLRDLARHIGSRHGQARIGAIGMCLTGGFVIPLLIEPAVQAAAASQPSVPFGLVRLALGERHGGGPWESRINVADADIDAAAACSRQAGKALLLQRFSTDLLCPQARIARLAKAFAGHAEVAEYEASPRRGRNWPPPHALLTEEFDLANQEGPAPDTDPTQRVLAQLTAFFRAQLRDSAVEDRG